MFSFRNRNHFKEPIQKAKNTFLGEVLEPFSTDQKAGNNPIKHLPELQGLGKVAFSGIRNGQKSIWVGYPGRSEFFEIPLTVLYSPERDHEWIEVKILRKLIALGHKVEGLDILIHLDDHGIFQNRFMESFSFAKAINESLGLNIQQSRLFAIVDSALSDKFGKRKMEVHGIFSEGTTAEGEIWGNGIFSFSETNPVLPVLFFARKGYNALWNHGITKNDINDLELWPKVYWSEFLSPLEQHCLGFLKGLIESELPSSLQVRKDNPGIVRTPVFHAA